MPIRDFHGTLAEVGCATTGGADIRKPRIPTRSIRVGLVDDHPSVLASIAAAIADSDDLDLVAVAATVDGAVDLAFRVDVLVCDVNLGDGAEGIRILRSINDPRRPRHGHPPAVLFLSAFGYPSLIRAALEAGASGYLDKTADLPDILDAVRSLASGGTAFSAAALHRSRDARRRPSDREIEVLQSIVDGATNAEVGAALKLSEKTVESHLRRLFDRYGLLSRTELAVLAIEEGWVAGRRLRT
jgi:two-component system, NarL family, response regulator DevR